jgi:uncharacterized alkaline shock family protein YloU
MKVTVRLAVLFYMTTMLFIGCFTVLFVSNLIPFQDVMNTLQYIYYDENMRGVFGIVAAGMLLINYIFARSISGNQERGKTIAFDNPAGRVSVSLVAMEDLVRRVIARVPEVKEVRSSITAGKKGLSINSRLVLNADVNIPEMTSRLQDLVKRKIQDTIGIEETVVVRVHIVKIIPDNKARRHKEKEENETPPEPTVPFQGYRV